MKRRLKILRVIAVIVPNYWVNMFVITGKIKYQLSCLFLYKFSKLTKWSSGNVQDLCHATRYIRTSSNPTGYILIKFFSTFNFLGCVFLCVLLLFFVCCFFLVCFDFFRGSLFWLYCIFWLCSFLCFFCGFLCFCLCFFFIFVFKFQSQLTK